jgi:hypothetical protein
LACPLTQSGGMAERQNCPSAGRAGLRCIVGANTADMIKTLDELKAKGSITEAEYSKHRAKLI